MCDYRVTGACGSPPIDKHTPRVAREEEKWAGLQKIRRISLAARAESFDDGLSRSHCQFSKERKGTLLQLQAKTAGLHSFLSRKDSRQIIHAWSSGVWGCGLGGGVGVHNDSDGSPSNRGGVGWRGGGGEKGGGVMGLMTQGVGWG